MQEWPEGWPRGAGTSLQRRAQEPERDSCGRDAPGDGSEHRTAEPVAERCYECEQP